MNSERGSMGMLFLQQVTEEHKFYCLGAREKGAGQVAKIGSRVRKKKGQNTFEKIWAFGAVCITSVLAGSEYSFEYFKYSYFILILQVRAHRTRGNLGLSMPHAGDKCMSSITRAVSLLHLINTTFTLKLEEKEKKKEKKMHLIYYIEDKCKQHEFQPKVQQIISNTNKQKVSGVEVHSQSDFIKAFSPLHPSPLSAASLRSHVSLFSAHRFPWDEFNSIIKVTLCTNWELQCLGNCSDAYTLAKFSKQKCWRHFKAQKHPWVNYFLLVCHIYLIYSCGFMKWQTRLTIKLCTLFYLYFSWFFLFPPSI